MSVLDSIIQYKQLEQNQVLQNQQAIAGIFETFQRAKHTNIVMDLEKQRTKADLATKGLVFDENGEIKRDDSLLSPLEQITDKYKLAELAKNVGDRGMFDAVMGDSSSAGSKNTSVIDTLPAAQAPSDLYTQATEIDPFTGKETGTALKAKQEIELDTAKKKEELKGIDPMFKKQEPFFQNVLGNKQELYDTLFKKDAQGNYLDEFNENVKGASFGGAIPLITAAQMLDKNNMASPMSEKRQRLTSILGDVNKANELLLARNLQGGGNEKTKAIRINRLTNPKAFKKELDEFFTQTEQALGNINPSFKKGATNDGWKDLGNGVRIREKK